MYIRYGCDLEYTSLKLIILPNDNDTDILTMKIGNWDFLWFYFESDFESEKSSMPIYTRKTHIINENTGNINLNKINYTNKILKGTMRKSFLSLAHWSKSFLISKN